MKTLVLLLKFLIYVAPILSQTIPEDDSSPILPATAENHKHPHCDCYLVSGQNQGYFQHYQLWDFRNAPIPRDTVMASDSVFGANAVPLSRSHFAADWNTQNWNRRPTSQKPVPILNSVNNIFFAQDPLLKSNGSNSTTEFGNTYLVLRTTRLDKYNSAAELENRLTNVFRCSFRVRLRMLPYGRLANDELGWNRTNHNITNSMTPGGPPKGACAGIFTIDPSGGESDIEILTKDPSNIIHYANQPDYDWETDETIPGASTIAAVQTPWTEWATHRLDWFPNLSVWYVDDHIHSSKTYKVPDMPSTLVINLWSDGGDWTGDMKVGESAFMGIEWIQLAYNISGQSRDVPGGDPGKANISGEERKKKKQKGDDDDDDDDEGDYHGHDEKCRRPCWLDDVR
ncbi:glycoside hydrolase family 16 protein [Aspergillus ruber CBS 135680]|uniref:Concanavalin A-like lectin/glucanase n=1 Tax=Aspergillus ruber (strain CBS 135680) TaxID=1388766 RepID=A0A017S7B5_ASPRC|nr:concanavalin A-like lectin/glucanase [Aspergillus ruber CBS 135680]EYE92933.1 concanavalin A-like lectin/glucanase [Aspergillus ruber CBS 135680]